MNCINKNSPEFKQLKAVTGINEFVLSAKISAWQDINGVDLMPTVSDLGIITEDVFDQVDLLNYQYGEEVDLGNSVYYKISDDAEIPKRKYPFDSKIVIKERPNGDRYFAVRSSNPVLEVAQDALNNQYEKDFDQPFDTHPKANPEVSEKTAEQVAYFTDLLDVEFIYEDGLKNDDGSPAAGVLLPKSDPLVKKHGKPVIKLNPSYLQEDTVGHEVAHLFIDMLGGTANGRIKAAVNKLKGTKLYEEQSKSLEGEKLNKEVLAIALGKEVRSLFVDQANKNWWNKFIDWMYSLLSLRLNVNETELRSLAKDIFKGDFKVNVSNLSEYNQYQTFDSSTIKNQAITLDRILQNSSNRLDALLSRWKHENKQNENTELVQAAEKLRDDLEDHISKQNAAGLVNIVDYIDSQFAETQKDLENDELKSYQVSNLTHFSNSLNIIKDINELLRDGKDPSLSIFTEEELKDLQIKVNEVLGKESKVLNALKSKSVEIVAKRLASESKREEMKFRVLAEKEFLANNPRGDMAKDEYNKRKYDYVEKYIQDNKDLIKDQQLNYFTRQLERGLDITSAMYILDSGQVNSSVIQVIQKMLDRADFQTASSVMNRRLELIKAYDNYVSKYGFSKDQSKMYDKFIHETDKGLYLLNKYLPEFNEIVTDYRIKISQAKTDKERLKLQNEYENWLAENATQKLLGTQYVTTPKSQWIDKRYASLSKEDKTQLEELRKLFTKDDKGIPESSKIESKRSSIKVTRLPNLNKSFAQRVFENSFGSAVKETIKDSFKVRAEDIELDPQGVQNQKQDLDLLFKEVFSKEDSEESSRIPIHFRAPIDKKDRSKDLFTLALMNHWTTENYKNKFAVSGDIELVSELLNEKKYIKNQNGFMYMSKLFKNKDGHIDDKLVSDKGTSNEVKMLRSIMDHRLYGVGEINRMIAGNISANKLANTVNSYASSTMLMLNYFAAVPNLIMGQSMNFIEAGGKMFYDDDNLKKAHSVYWKDFSNFMNDVGKVSPESKTGILLDLFEVMDSISGQGTKFIDKDSMRKFAKRDTLYFLSHGTEHYNQALMLYAILDNTQYKGKSLLEQISVKDGKLFVGDVEFNAKHKGELTDVMFNVRSKIKKVIADNHGQYDERMKSMVQREWYGKTAFMLRKWLLRGMTRRFKGIGKKSIYGVTDNINMDDVFFSEESDTFEEGNYVTTFRFLNNLRKDILNKQVDFTKSYNSLTDYEKSNIRKTFRELVLFSLYMGAYAVLASMAEGEDDDEVARYYYMGAYAFRRSAGELSFYVSIPEFTKIMRTPAASLNFVEKLFALPMAGLEQYERSGPGYEKGDYKILKKLEDLVPLYGQIFRYEEAQNILSYHTN